MGAPCRLTALKEYISDTEDLINLQLDQKRNSLIAVDLMISCGSFLMGGERDTGSS